MNTKAQKLANPTSFGSIVGMTKIAQQAIFNATINLPEYADPEFRLQEIDRAIRQLQDLRVRLVCDVALNNASR